MVKFLKILLRILIGLVIVIPIAGFVILRSPLPNHSDDISGLPLNDFVEVIRDERGVPHIYGTNVDDILFAQGYIHAQDRFWQLEFWSHLSTGRLASLIGEPGIGDPSGRSDPLQEGRSTLNPQFQREEWEYQPVGGPFTAEQRAEMDRRLEEKRKNDENSHSESYLSTALNFWPFSSKGALSNVNFTSKHMGGSYNKKKKRSYKRRVKRTHRKQH